MLLWRSRTGSSKTSEKKMLTANMISSSHPSSSLLFIKVRLKTQPSSYLYSFFFFFLISRGFRHLPKKLSNEEVILEVPFQCAAPTNLLQIHSLSRKSVAKTEYSIIIKWNFIGKIIELEIVCHFESVMPLLQVYRIGERLAVYRSSAKSPNGLWTVYNKQHITSGISSN